MAKGSQNPNVVGQNFGPRAQVMRMIAEKQAMKQNRGLHRGQSVLGDVGDGSVAALGNDPNGVPIGGEGGPALGGRDPSQYTPMHGDMGRGLMMREQSPYADHNVPSYGGVGGDISRIAQGAGIPNRPRGGSGGK